MNSQLHIQIAHAFKWSVWHREAIQNCNFLAYSSKSSSNVGGLPKWHDINIFSLEIKLEA